jgi:hypothetical protein
MWRRILPAMLICAVLPTAVRAQNEHWQVGATPTFSTGKYGTDTRTEIVYTPIVARRLFDDGDLTLVFPHLCISGDGAVTVVSGSPVRTGRTETARPGTATTPDRGATRERANQAAVNLSRGTGTIAQKVRHCGLGDIVARGRYYVLDERGWIPTLAIRGHIKAPTADDTRGLGTGRPDEGIALEASRMLGRGFTAMVDGGYTIVGKPVDTDFRNAWWYDVGVAQDLASGSVNVSVFFEEYSSVVPVFVNARDILLTLSLKSASGWRVQLSGEFGMSDGAPDHGFTFGASRRF